jgi:hypothetical protein
MDRISRAAQRLWGNIGSGGELGGFPAFAAELDACCQGDLSIESPNVSKWSAGRQLEHLYLSSHYVLDRIEEALSGANEADHMGIYGVGLMVGGFIPRYVFPTIPILVPKSGTLEHIDPLRNTLGGRLEKIAWDLERVQSSRGKSKHPRMKYLTAGQWIFFADIHHRHHLSLIRDILRADAKTHPAGSRASTESHNVTASVKKDAA